MIQKFFKESALFSLTAAVAALAVGMSVATAQNTYTAQTNAIPAVPAGLTLYPFGSPTGDAVEMLELINRARSNPAVEGQRLVDALNAAYPSGGSGFDMTQLAGQFATYPVRPPMVFNANLDAAATAHLADNVRLGTESHNSPDGTPASVRVQQFGYTPLYSENCNGTAGYSIQVRPWTLQSTYELSDPGHLGAILENGDGLGQVEAGIGFQSTGGWNVEDFGGDSTVTLLGGVVFNDNAGSGFYVSGEGVNDVMVTSNASSYYAISVNGAYSLPLDLAPAYNAGNPNPTVTVTFTTVAGDTTTKSVTLGHTVSANGMTYYNPAGQIRYDNAKSDWVMAASETPTPTPTPDPTPTPTPAAQADVTISPAPDGAGFIVSRTGDTSNTLMVTYKIKGTAVAGQDYLPLSGTKKIKPSKRQVRINVTMLPGATGTLKLELTGTDAYTVGTPAKAKVKLLGPS